MRYFLIFLFLFSFQSFASCKDIFNSRVLSSAKNHYYRGQYTEAFRIIKELAETSSNVEAKYFLSFFYSQGIGVSKDESKATYWLKQSYENYFQPS